MNDNATPTNKKGLVAAIVALVALVAVVGIGYFAYQQLAGQAGGNNTPLVSSHNGGASAAASSSTTASSHSSNAIWLADYDATVFNEYGDATTLTKIADGKPLVINFWATWCTYCVREMPDYQELYDEYGDRVSFAFVDCVYGTRETADKAAAWLYENEYNLPAYYDNNLSAQSLFGITSIPTTVIVSADGEILTITTGQIDPDRMREALDTVLGE